MEQKRRDAGRAGGNQGCEGTALRVAVKAPLQEGPGVEQPDDRSKVTPDPPGLPRSVAQEPRCT